MVFELINRGEHLTHEGLQQIVNLRASMNLGLSDELKEAFPDVKPVLRPLIVDQKIQDPNWVAGFVSGENNKINVTTENTDLVIWGKNLSSTAIPPLL